MREFYSINVQEDSVFDQTFQLHYQPQISLVTKAVNGVEVLLRKRGNGEKLISPSEFIPELERSGEMIEVGKWVIERSFQQLKTWQSKGKTVAMSVNISAVQLGEQHFADFVKNVLEACRLNPELIEFELTESFPFSDRALYTTLLEIKRMGIRVALDDFGTGFSSLSYLENLPIDTLKIDKCFVDKISGSPVKVPVLDAIITMASELNMEIIAEGIEREDQLAYLRNRSCRLGQGFYFYRPMPAEDIEKILDRNLKNIGNGANL